MEYMKLVIWGQEHELCIRKENYREGNGMSLYLYEPDVIGYHEPWGSMTVNTEAYSKLKHDGICALVDTNNCPEAIQLIDKYRLGKPTGRINVSGYCTYPEYRFDMSEIKKYCLNPGEIREEGSKPRKNTKNREER